MFFNLPIGTTRSRVEMDTPALISRKLEGFDYKGQRERERERVNKEEGSKQIGSAAVRLGHYHEYIGCKDERWKVEGEERGK
jgi:hypothetical protein